MKSTKNISSLLQIGMSVIDTYIRSCDRTMVSNMSALDLQAKVVKFKGYIHSNKHNRSNFNFKNIDIRINLQ